MSKVIGLILIIAGIGLGLYFGVWWALVGGIKDIVYAVRADILIMSDVLWGVCKVFFAGMIGTFCAMVPVAFGTALMED